MLIILGLYEVPVTCPLEAVDFDDDDSLVLGCEAASFSLVVDIAATTLDEDKVF